MTYLNRELYKVNELQEAIIKSPSFRNGMKVVHIGSGVEIQINGKAIDINEQCLVLADADNWIRNGKK